MLIRTLLASALLLSFNYSLEGANYRARKPVAERQVPGRDARQPQRSYAPVVPTGRPIRAVKEDTKSLRFEKMIISIPTGKKIGILHYGTFMMLTQELNWTKGILNVTDDETVNTVFKEFKNANYPMIGNPESLFGNRSFDQAELLLGGTIRDIRIEAQAPTNLLTGNTNLKKAVVWVMIDWEVYSPMEQRVIKKITTQGSYSGKELKFQDAIGNATKNLLADRDFYASISQQRARLPIQRTGQEALRIKSEPLSREALGANITNLRGAIPTVFAGEGHGSAFFISKEGYLITNAHVVAQSKFVKIKLPTGRDMLGEVVRTNVATDVALIKVEEEVPVALALRLDSPHIGSDVFAIGSPLDHKFQTSVTKGIVSGYRTENGQTLIQSDVRALPGNSGGPLVDGNGNVVGISVKGLYYGGEQAMTFFIPISEALQQLNIEMN